MPTRNLSDVILALNAVAQNRLVLLQRLQEIFHTHLEWAGALIPSYAHYLSPTDFDALGTDFPTLQPLLMGYRNMGKAA